VWHTASALLWEIAYQHQLYGTGIAVKGTDSMEVIRATRARSGHGIMSELRGLSKKLFDVARILLAVVFLFAIVVMIFSPGGLLAG